MLRLASAVGFLSIVLVAVFASAPAQAQATRTWVSGVGDDANPCSRTAPCKTFAGAISKTAAGGIHQLHQFRRVRRVTITKAITHGLLTGSGEYPRGPVPTASTSTRSQRQASLCVACRSKQVPGRVWSASIISMAAPSMSSIAGFPAFAPAPMHPGSGSRCRTVQAPNSSCLTRRSSTAGMQRPTAASWRSAPAMQLRG